MAYITKGNANKILRQIDISSLPTDFPKLKGEIYKKKISIFSNNEINRLLLRKELLRNPDGFFKLYCKIEKRPDTYRYIHEGGSPAYHESPDCIRLTSDFTAYEIPLIIQERGKNEVVKFRIWFSQNRDIFENDNNKFTESMQNYFRITDDIKPVEYKNSGIEIFENLDLSGLEDKIDDLLKSVTNFIIESNTEIREIIMRYGKRTFLAYTKHEITDNDTALNDKDLRKFLEDYSQKFKIPIEKYLSEYYRVYFNPDLQFEGPLLEEVGFKKCSLCCITNVLLTDD
ncbi:hypothetical protein [Hymenobacter rubripertinctus]|uniref:hypothetical protein n=1 Tax=Hymenobacter rubripertinctus TaxID=2029981 RepID=UPI0011C48047|nr:hypothetical protein [Hymenobacter rubripertinctus]